MNVLQLLFQHGGRVCVCVCVRVCACVCRSGAPLLLPRWHWPSSSSSTFTPPAVWLAIDTACQVFDWPSYEPLILQQLTFSRPSFSGCVCVCVLTRVCVWMSALKLSVICVSVCVCVCVLGQIHDVFSEAHCERLSLSVRWFAGRCFSAARGGRTATPVQNFVSENDSTRPELCGRQDTSPRLNSSGFRLVCIVFTFTERRVHQKMWIHPPLLLLMIWSQVKCRSPQNSSGASQ